MMYIWRCIFGEVNDDGISLLYILEGPAPYGSGQGGYVIIILHSNMQFKILLKNTSNSVIQNTSLQWKTWRQECCSVNGADL